MMDIPSQIKCPNCSFLMIKRTKNIYSNNFYCCEQNCFPKDVTRPYISFETHSNKIIENSMMYHVPFLYNKEFRILCGTKFLDKDKNKTIIIQSYPNKILIETDLIPIDLHNTKQSAQNIFDRLIKLIPFI
jgi:hypothetical protein